MSNLKTVAVVDYGSGNLRSVSQAVRHVVQGTGYEVLVTSNPQDVLNAERVVLPGQGAMHDCMLALEHSGMLGAVLHAAASKPLFGVCVGMQMLLDNSHEGLDGAPTPGLGLIHGEVVKFDLAGQLQPDGSRFKVPQMGWNQVYQSHPDGAQAHPAVGRRARWLVFLLCAQLLRLSVGCAPHRGRGGLWRALCRGDSAR